MVAVCHSIGMPVITVKSMHDLFESLVMIQTVTEVEVTVIDYNS